MTTETPPDWVLLEAADQSEMLERNPARLRLLRGGDKVYRALCDMIAKHEKKPVDRKVLCAREAITQSHDENFRSNICHWEWIAIRAIELWEEGFGK
jgi:hypothetical protein